MRRRDRIKNKGRRESGSFIAIPKVVLESENYRSLSARAIKLLIDILLNYNGSNNGDFCAAWSLMRTRGWRSEASLREGISELTHYGFIVLARQGDKRRPSLFAITWLAVDQCDGKLDIAATAAPLGYWRQPVKPWSPPSRKPQKSSLCTPAAADYTPAAGVKLIAQGG